MASHRVIAFWNAMRSDKLLYEQYMEAARNGDEDQWQSVVELARSKGFEFTVEQYITALQKKAVEHPTLQIRDLDRSHSAADLLSRRAAPSD